MSAPFVFRPALDRILPARKHVLHVSERIGPANDRCDHGTAARIGCDRGGRFPCKGIASEGSSLDDRREIRTDEAPRGTGAYSQAIRAGDFVFISGQGPLDPASLQVVGTDIEEQTERTLRNVEAIARAAGGSLRNVVKVSAFLSSIDLFPRFNAVYEGVFDFEPRPARTTTGAELRNILVEIDAVLHLPR
jgi:2-iminobutanoate/2-iminopropanoate deaminase